MALGFSLGFLGFSLKAPQKPKAMTERNHKSNSFGKKTNSITNWGESFQKTFPKFNYMNLERNMNQERNYLGMTPLTKID